MIGAASQAVNIVKQRIEMINKEENICRFTFFFLYSKDCSLIEELYTIIAKNAEKEKTLILIMQH
ncbi:24464_t:CDS:2 [Cetraspora pellucida]|uniref:24464_t:CDS:1 n=1 Tax=Cetraspora pellucida TaxID=1433469 RepID=A0A9N9HCD8_9GLOM|nr:24464_t:CDS:2 [Cetraspora pellucida]